MCLSYSGVAAVTLEGTEWITFQVYDDMETQQAHSSSSRIALDFKARYIRNLHINLYVQKIKNNHCFENAGY